MRLLVAGRVDFAVLDIHDLGLAREKGRDLVGVMALVQRPLAAVLAQPGIRRPRDLEGKRVGVTGLPSDDAVLRSIVEGDGGDASQVRKITIGFSAVRLLLTKRVAGATAFWNVEGLELRAKRPGIREFRVDDYGAPTYPELVLCTMRQTLDERATFVAATLRALRRGYQTTLDDPGGQRRRPRRRGARHRPKPHRQPARRDRPRLRRRAGANRGPGPHHARGMGAVGREVRDPPQAARRPAGLRAQRLRGSSSHLDPEHRDQALLVLGVDARDDLDVLLEAGAAELGRQQLVDLEDAGAVGHLDLDADGLLAARGDLDLLDRVGRQRVDVLVAGLERHARAAAGHVERVGDADDPGLDRERLALRRWPMIACSASATMIERSGSS